MLEMEKLKEKIKDLKVLFVDDEEDIRNSTGKFLKKFFQNVTICEDGEEALNVFKKDGDFNVVITDILMPKMDGVTLAKEIRKINKVVYIVFLTAFVDTKSELDLQNMTLYKPLGFEDMVQLMKILGEQDG
jgi:CheY-like chemotaxis protein